MNLQYIKVPEVRNKHPTISKAKTQSLSEVFVYNKRMKKDV